MSLTRRSFVWRAGGGLFASAATAGLYAWLIEPHWVEVVERELPIRRLPAALVGKRLVQISDLHVGPRVDDQYLMRALDRVNALRPNILVITGDFVSYWGDRTFPQLERVLKHLPRGRCTTLAVLGNHDYGRGWSQEEVADNISKRLRRLGVVVLRNERCMVDGLQVVGLDDFLGSALLSARSVERFGLKQVESGTLSQSGCGGPSYLGKLPRVDPLRTHSWWAM